MTVEDSPRAHSTDPGAESGASLGDFGLNSAIVDEIRALYDLDPGAVDPAWRAVFENGGAAAQVPAPVQPPIRVPLPVPEVPRYARVEERWNKQPVEEGTLGPTLAKKHARVLRLIHAYRARGHRVADTDPLSEPTSSHFPFPELDPAYYGFGDEDLDQRFIAGDLPGGPEQTLREILGRLHATYCEKVGVEYTHIQTPERKAWLQKRLETTQNRTHFSHEERLNILEQLSKAEILETFLHTKFVGQKRFSLEGGESLIPLMDELIERGPDHGIIEFVIGMAHRGRLNVLCNVLDKSPEVLFSEFEDEERPDSPMGSGDVKYHKGFSVDRMTRSGVPMHLSLTANPSHLEAVNPVVEGRARAKQTRVGDRLGRKIVPLLLHGDAAFAGQGVVTETLNLSHLPGYSTGGTVHVVVNNQIGFTTAALEARSTLYATDVAKIIQAPIFHVNGDSPEAVVHVARLALEYRQRFGEDVVIDLICYRRHGHNESDEPSFTNPVLYSKIRAKESTRKIYADQLIESGGLTAAEVKELGDRLRAGLEASLVAIHVEVPRFEEPLDPERLWKGFARPMAAKVSDELTGVTREELVQIAAGLSRAPEGFHLHPKLKRLIEGRSEAVLEAKPIDWALGEALAFGSLVTEGTRVRLSGQDSGRGTFSHRHAVLVDQKTAEEHVPLDNLDSEQARFEVFDSLLSEAAVLGFEYGYSLADPSTLTLWEAQFGDFANGAQVIIDQFLITAESKWQRMSGLVLLLPHGYEGQGPEHSSARIERYLQLCAEDNIQVVNCTTPAQYFHVLRRQMRRNYRLPLVVFTPKSLLRAPYARSSVEEFTYGKYFQLVIEDARARQAPDEVRRLLLCSGKVYYDLLAQQEKLEGDAPRVAVVRMEQIYPWPEEELRRIIARYPKLTSICWVQEEPKNMGAWTFVQDRIDALLPATVRVRFIGRVASASPAVGSARVHRQEPAEQKIQGGENLRIDHCAGADAVFEPGSCAIELHFVDLDLFGLIASPGADFLELTGCDEVDHL